MIEEPNKKSYDVYRDRQGLDVERGREFPPEERKEGEAELEKPKETTAREMPEEVAHPTPHPPHISEEIEKETKQIKKLPQERQIQALVDLALHKGLRHSIDTARALGNPYILDQFHDMLVDHLYKELVEKGKLKEL